MIQERIVMGVLVVCDLLGKALTNVSSLISNTKRCGKYGFVEDWSNYLTDKLI